MNYFDSTFSELLEIIISFLHYDQLNSFISILNNNDSVNWSIIFSYRFGYYQQVNKDKYIAFISIESLKMN